MYIVPEHEGIDAIWSPNCIYVMPWYCRDQREKWGWDEKADIAKIYKLVMNSFLKFKAIYLDILISRIKV